MFTSRLTTARSSPRLFIWKLWRLSVMYLTFSQPTSWANLDWVLLIFDFRSNKDGLGREKVYWRLSWLFSEWHYICLPQPAARNFNTGLLSHLRSSIASCILYINRTGKVLSSWIEIIDPIGQQCHIATH